MKKATLSPELFDQFWRAYPRRVAKGQAEKAWLKIKPTVELVADMVKALEWQTRQPAWRDVEFVPYPATWLNARRWEDEPFTPAVKAFAPRWKVECREKHAGRCTNSFFHAAMMDDESAK